MISYYGAILNARARTRLRGGFRLLRVIWLYSNLHFYEWMNECLEWKDQGFVGDNIDFVRGCFGKRKSTSLIFLFISLSLHSTSRRHILCNCWWSARIQCIVVDEGQLDVCSKYEIIENFPSRPVGSCYCHDAMHKRRGTGLCSVSLANSEASGEFQNVILVCSLCFYIFSMISYSCWKHQPK